MSMGRTLQCRIETGRSVLVLCCDGNCISLASIIKFNGRIPSRELCGICHPAADRRDRHGVDTRLQGLNVCKVVR